MGLDRETLKAFKRQLIEARRSLSENVSTELDALKGQEGHHLADMEDLASDTSDEATTYRVLELESGQLGQIDHALQRIEDGTYGTCEDCGDTIDVERLQALPFATRCVPCKRSQEAAPKDKEEEGTGEAE